MAAVKDDLSSNASFNEAQVKIKAGQISSEIEKIALKLKSSLTHLTQSDNRVTIIIEIEANELCQKLGQYYLNQAQNNPCATRETRQEWTNLGN